jgi:hypothetical protein
MLGAIEFDMPFRQLEEDLPIVITIDNDSEQPDVVIQQLSVTIEYYVVPFTYEIGHRNDGVTEQVACTTHLACGFESDPDDGKGIDMVMFGGHGISPNKQFYPPRKKQSTNKVTTPGSNKATMRKKSERAEVPDGDCSV